MQNIDTNVCCNSELLLKKQIFEIQELKLHNDVNQKN